MTVVAPDPLLDGGLLPVDRARETWWVRAGAATAVPVHAGDRMTISALAGAFASSSAACAISCSARSRLPAASSFLTSFSTTRRL